MNKSFRTTEIDRRLSKYILGTYPGSLDNKDPGREEEYTKIAEPRYKLREKHPRYIFEKYMKYINDRFESMTNFPNVPYSSIYLGQQNDKTRDVSSNTVQYLFLIWQSVTFFNSITFVYDMISRYIPNDLTFKSKYLILNNLNGEVKYNDKIIFNTTTLDIGDAFNEFIEEINSKNYDILVYAIRVSQHVHDHANLLVFTKDKDNNIKAVYYEPYGYNSLCITSKTFLSYLENYLDISVDNTALFVRDKLENKSGGLQHIMSKYDIGWCVLFSMYWLYVCIRFLILHKTFRLDIIEYYITDKFENNPEAVLQNMINFGSFYVNYCNENYGNVLELLNRARPRFTQTFESHKSTIQNIERYFGKEKQKDGDDCKEDSNCASGYCENGKCVPPYRVKRIVSLGSSCTKNGECEVGKCVNNRCIRLDIGDDCFEGIECDSGSCNKGKCRKVPLYGKCEKDRSCEYGYCRDNTCIPKKSGSKCLVKEDCESGICVNGKCLEMPRGLLKSKIISKYR
jgi:hypothetical protein